MTRSASEPVVQVDFGFHIGLVHLGGYVIKDNSIPELIRKLEVENSFSYKWETDQRGRQRLVFYQTIRCGNTEKTIEFPESRILFLDLLQEGWRRYVTLEEAEEVVAGAIVN